MIRQGADMLLNSIIDSCVDSFIPFISEFDKYVDTLTDKLFKDPDQETLKKIYVLKSQIVSLRYSIGSQADILMLLAKNNYNVISPSATVYFRNIYDNFMRLNDMIGAARDTITGAMEIYAFTVSNRLNEIMKTLTIIATIMMPLTLIASIYGMNFKHMPELNSPLGYPTVIIIMATIIVSMLFYFKRKKWL
jgi:magnesium transporter